MFGCITAHRNRLDPILFCVANDGAITHRLYVLIVYNVTTLDIQWDPKV